MREPSRGMVEEEVKALANEKPPGCEAGGFLLYRIPCRAGKLKAGVGCETGGSSIASPPRKKFESGLRLVPPGVCRQRWDRAVPAIHSPPF
jgi:hypothetical protein